MDILVIDGLGGGIGKSICEAIKRALPDCTILGVGTNTVASAAMKKGGADRVASGENAIIYNATHAKIIVGPIGILFGNAMLGEISPAMANAISCSEAKKYLIPMSQCSGKVMGVQEKSVQEYINEFITSIK